MPSATLKRGDPARVAADSLHLAGQIVTIIGYTNGDGPRMVRVETKQGKGALLPPDFLEPVSGSETGAAQLSLFS